MNFYFNLMQACVALFIVVDPLGNVPIFLGLTRGMSEKRRSDTIVEALYVSFLLLLLFALAGTWILDFFNINLNDFKIAGGLLLLVVSLSILRGNYIESLDLEEDVGAVPLGIPLLAGPGAITTSMVLIGVYGMWVTLAAVLINFILAGLILSFYGKKIYDLFGKSGSQIIAKVMAIMLAAIAVKFMREGVMNLFRFSV